MRNESEVFEKGDEAIANGSNSKAVLYFDEAVRRYDTNPRSWLKLSYALYRSDQVWLIFNLINLIDIF